MLNFRLLVPLSTGKLSEVLNELHVRLRCMMTVEQFRPHQLLFTRVYYSDIQNQRAVLLSHALYDTLKNGMVSHIEQPPLGGGKVALQFVYTDDENVSQTHTPTASFAVTEAADFIFEQLRPVETTNGHADSEVQTRAAFTRHAHTLHQRAANLQANCLRTWFYVRDIDRNYQGVVKGRNTIFRQEGLTADTHYIASTGIGGESEQCGSLVAADFFSVCPHVPMPIQYLHAPDYLNATREYGVAFERGTAFDLQGKRYVLISGTASIDKAGQVVHEGDVLTQAGRMFLNIEKLLEQAHASLQQVAYMVVYLRDVADYVPIERYLRFRFPTTDFLIVLARVCRPQWLIETECVAVLDVPDENNGSKNTR